MYNKFPKNTVEFTSQLRNIIEDKVILITGGTGSLGKALIKKLLQYNPKKIKILSRTEENRAAIKHEFRKLFGDVDKIIEYIPGSINETDAVERALWEVNIIFHLAAMKRIEECELYPAEAIKINCKGTQTLTQLILENGNIEHIIGASSDKACHPTNVYGNTKKTMENIFLAAQKEAIKRNLETKFSLVRGGNFLGSTGSVIPFWIKAAKAENVLEITDPTMKRFTMLLDEAANLFLWTLANSQGGQIITREMPIIILKDLAGIISRNYGVSTKIVGLRLIKGEKIIEELISNTEKLFTITTPYPLKTKYLRIQKKFRIFILTPGRKSRKKNLRIFNYYLTKTELYKMLKRGESYSGEWIR
jgi:FlaA1/EpsC-like NDP-sugar epimerase